MGQMYFEKCLIFFIFYNETQSVATFKMSYFVLLRRKLNHTGLDLELTLKSH